MYKDAHLQFATTISNNNGVKVMTYIGPVSLKQKIKFESKNNIFEPQ